MSEGLFGWFLRASGGHNKETEVSALFNFLRSCINREDLIDNIWKRYEKAAALADADREKEYINLYFALEQFITSQKPLIVKEEWTKDTLRAHIRTSLNVYKFPMTLGFLFFPEKEQAVAFFTIATRDIVKKLAATSGPLHTESIITSVLRDKRLAIVVKDDGLRYEKIDESLTLDELHTQFAACFRLLYEDVAATLGKTIADEQMQNTHIFIETTYGAEFLDEFFSLLPQNVLATERLAYLSKEDVTHRVTMATQQQKRKTEEAETLARQLAQKVNEMEAQYKTIEDTKRAMLNLLEDARALEGELTEERDRANAIITAVGEGLFVVDNTNHVVLMNPSAERMLGISAKECTGKLLSEVTHFQKGSRALSPQERPLYKTLKEGQSIFASLEDDMYIGAKERLVPISLVTAPITRDGKIVGALETFNDITKDKEVKATIEGEVTERTKQLNQEHARLTSSINSLVAGFILTDPDGNIFSKNPASVRILGLNPTVACLEDVEKSMEGSIKLHELHEQAKKDKKPVSIKDVEFKGRFLELFVAPIFVDQAKNDFIGTVILVSDVTEEKILQRSRDEFFSIASHELRTPLTAIRGNTSMLQEFYADKMDDEMKGMINDVHESSVQLIEIVNDFLNMSRLEQKKITFAKDIFDLPELIRVVLKEYQVTGSRRKLYLTYKEPDKPVPLVVADKARVKEILINLVGNSLKFTEEGGVTVNLYLHDGKVRVIVEDTGKGIPFENQVLLFRKFQQAGDNLFTRDTRKGTGLGLYISKLLVEGMGGTIGLVHSQPGKGSAFGFSLPVAPGQKIPEGTPSDAAPWPHQTQPVAK